VSQPVTIFGFPGHFAKFPDSMKIRAIVPSILQTGVRRDLDAICTCARACILHSRAAFDSEEIVEILQAQDIEILY